jgi:hypothetical protein
VASWPTGSRAHRVQLAGRQRKPDVAPRNIRRDRLASVVYSVVSAGTAPSPLLTVVSVLTDVSLVMIVVSRVSLGVITVSFVVPTRSVCPELHPPRVSKTSAPASANRILPPYHRSRSAAGRRSTVDRPRGIYPESLRINGPRRPREECSPNSRCAMGTCSTFRRQPRPLPGDTPVGLGPSV